MYFNITSQIVSSARLDTSFTTDIQFNNFDNGAVQVVWSGADAVTATFQLWATVDGVNFSSLSTMTTLTTAGSSQLYNITDGGYNSVRCVYAAVSNTTGTIDVWSTRKSRR